MKIVQLAASPFLGGPEKQMLGLARNLPRPYQTVFLSFPEGGKSEPFLAEARAQGFTALALKNNTPHYQAAVRELAGHLRCLKADILCCNGYKPDILGWRAARLTGIPVMSISHGWTGATWKVRLNETLDRFVLRFMDRVVCVSEGQAIKIRKAGIAPERVRVIRNAIDIEPFDHPDPSFRALMESWLPEGCRQIVGAGGRLSPEKGFEVFVEAAAIVARKDPSAGFVVFGDGPRKQALIEQIQRLGLQNRVILGGFRTDLEKFLPHFDVAVLSSHTEGLPVFVLEALAAGVPVVATSVGGTPEVVENGINGYLSPPREPQVLAGHILELLGDDKKRKEMGGRGRERIRKQFTFRAQGFQYQELFDEIGAGRRLQKIHGTAKVEVPVP